MMITPEVWGRIPDEAPPPQPYTTGPEPVSDPTGYNSFIDFYVERVGLYGNSPGWRPVG